MFSGGERRRVLVRRLGIGGAWLTLVATTTACGAQPPTDASGPGTSTAPSSPSTPDATSSATPAGTLEARTIVRQALRRWQLADTGRFTQTVSLGGTGTTTTTGSYSLSARSSTATMVVDVPGQPAAEFRVVAVDDVSYLQSSAWDPALRACWFRYDVGSMEQITGMTAAPAAGGLPGNVIALSYARGVSVDPDDPHVLHGTVDMTTAASMFGSGLLREIADMSLDAPVAAELTLADGVVESWQVAGRDLADALEREDALVGSGAKVLTALPLADVTVEYDDLGAPVRVEVPDRDSVMTMAQGRSGAGCSAARS